MAENGNASGNGSNVGRVEQVTGVVVDAVFPDQLPEIYSAVKIEVPEGNGRQAIDLTCEVQQHGDAVTPPRHRREGPRPLCPEGVQDGERARPVVGLDHS